MCILQAWTNVCSEDNPTPDRYWPVTLFHSGPADHNPSAAVYGERQVIAAPGHFQVTFRARERHVTQWTELTEGRPAIVDSDPPSANTADWDPKLRDVSERRTQCYD